MFIELTLPVGGKIIVNGTQIICIRSSASGGSVIETTGVQSDGKPRKISVTENQNVISMKLRGL